MTVVASDTLEVELEEENYFAFKKGEIFNYKLRPVDK